jgi:putative addiction module component (TIGR02574 family)
MTSAVEHLKSQAELLSVRERVDLALFLLHSLEPQEPGAEDAWQTQIARRVAEIRRRAVCGIPIDEVLANLRSRYP